MPNFGDVRVRAIYTQRHVQAHPISIGAPSSHWASIFPFIFDTPCTVILPLWPFLHNVLFDVVTNFLACIIHQIISANLSKRVIWLFIWGY